MASDQFCSDGGKQALHDEGRVGAEHHHFAVRHVDDAHHAEGDRQADRGEQQHRGGREAVPDVLRRCPRSASRVLIEASAASRRALDRGIVGLLRESSSIRLCASWSPRAFKASIAAERDRRAARRRRRREDRGARVPQAPSATRGSVSLASCASTRRQGLGVAGLEDGFRAPRRAWRDRGWRASASPIAASMALRSALLTRTFLSASTATSAIVSPVLALKGRRPRSCRRRCVVAGSINSRLSPSASRIAAACGGAAAASSADRLLGLGKLVVEELAPACRRARRRGRRRR